MGDPELTETIGVRVTDETREEVDDLVWKYRLTPSEVTRRLVRHALEDADENELFAEEAREREARGVAD